MPKRLMISQELEFLRWLRRLTPESQERIYQGVVTNALPQALASITGEQSHCLFEVSPTVGIQNDRFLVRESDFLNNVVSSAS